jgi:hypothetical protein
MNYLFATLFDVLRLNHRFHELSICNALRRDETVDRDGRVVMNLTLAVTLGRAGAMRARAGPRRLGGGPCDHDGARDAGVVSLAGVSS